MKKRWKDPAEEKSSEKKIFHKNQIVIAVLAIMIIVAGYLNFSEKSLDLADGNEIAMPLEEEVAKEDENAGEAVLTQGAISGYVTNVKLEREQTHAKVKDNLESIINNQSISEDEKLDAIDQMTKLSGVMEREYNTEQLLESKGFENSIVTIGENSVNVAVHVDDLTNTTRAQIEDIVCRGAECNLDEIVITQMKIETVK